MPKTAVSHDADVNLEARKFFLAYAPGEQFSFQLLSAMFVSGFPVLIIPQHGHEINEGQAASRRNLASIQ